MRWSKICALFGLLLVSINSFATDVVNVYTTSNYITDSTVADFERQCNCRLFLNYFSDPQEMAAKLAAGATGYDVIIGTGYALQDLHRMGKLSQLDLSKLPNLKNIDPKFLHQKFDPKNSFSVPYAYTPVFLAYNKTKLDKLGIIPNTWAVIFDDNYLKKLRGKVTVFDSQRNVYAAALLYLGKDPNSSSPDDLAKARALITHASQYWARYDSTTYYRSLLNGEIWLAMSYSNDLYNTLQDAQKSHLPYQIAGMMQREGNMIELDNLVIPVSSKHKSLAYMFINTVLKEQSALSLGQETGASVPNLPAIRKLPTDLTATNWIYPTQWQKIYGFSAYPPKTRIMVNEVWTEIKMECHQECSTD